MTRLMIESSDVYFTYNYNIFNIILNGRTGDSYIIYRLHYFSYILARTTRFRARLAVIVIQVAVGNECVLLIIGRSFRSDTYDISRVICNQQRPSRPEEGASALGILVFYDWLCKTVPPVTG